MATFTINVDPYVDLGYVEGGYLSDAFSLAGIEAELRDTGSLRTTTAAYSLTGVAAGLSSIRQIFPDVRSYSAAFIAAHFRVRTLAPVASFQASAFSADLTSFREFSAESTQFLLRGFGINFGEFIPPFTDGPGFSSDISDQSKDYEELRKAYGGSDNTSPSFLRPQYVRWNSVSKSRDLGESRALSAQIRGKVGTEVGSSAIYFRVDATEPSKIRYTKLPASNRYDDQVISIGLLDSDRKQIDLDDQGFAFTPQSDELRQGSASTDGQQSFQFLPAGVYYFTVSSSQWRSADYGVEISVGGTVLLSGTLPLEMDSSGRIAQSYLSGTATLAGESFGILVQKQLLTGTVAGRLDPVLTLSVTSPFSTG